MTDHEFNVEAMVHGYHIYYSVWDAAVDGEVLNCYREVGNTYYLSAIAVRKDAGTVGHIPRAISSICLIFYAEEELFHVGWMEAGGILQICHRED